MECPTALMGRHGAVTRSQGGESNPARCNAAARGRASRPGLGPRRRHALRPAPVPLRPGAGLPTSRLAWVVALAADVAFGVDRRHALRSHPVPLAPGTGRDAVRAFTGRRLASFLGFAGLAPAPYAVNAAPPAVGRRRRNAHVGGTTSGQAVGTIARIDGTGGAGFRVDPGCQARPGIVQPSLFPCAGAGARCYARDIADTATFRLQGLLAFTLWIALALDPSAGAVVAIRTRVTFGIAAARGCGAPLLSKRRRAAQQPATRGAFKVALRPCAGVLGILLASKFAFGIADA